MTIQQIEVDHAPDPDEVFLGFELIAPETGVALQSEQIRLDGWVLAKHGRVRKIEVMNGNLLWKTIPLTFSCPRAAKRHPEARGKKTCGFRGSFGTIGLSRKFELELFAVFHNGYRQRCASLRGTRQPIQTSYPPRFQPLLITSLARTGTTRMMQLLHGLPEVVLDANYPFETRSGCYWLHAIKVLSEPTHGKNTFESDLGSLTPCPMNSEAALRQPNVSEWFGNQYVDRVAEFAQQSIDEFYRIICKNENKGSARYFAEKSLPCHVQWIAGELYENAKEIILIRDFRDMVCSMIAFNQKRGFATFGRESVDSDADFIRLKIADANKLMETVRTRPKSLCVKYEDLVLEPVSTMERISRYLEVRSDSAMIKTGKDLPLDTQAKLDAHRTTENAAESVGRWQRDLPPQLKALCNRNFGPLLEEAGYDA